MVPQQALCFAVVPQLYLSSVLAPVPLKCPEISSLTLCFCLKTLHFCNGTLVSAVFCSGASVVPRPRASSSSSQMSRDKLLDYAFLYQTHDGHDGSKTSTCTTLCRPVSLKCPEISSLPLRFRLNTCISGVVPRQSAGSSFSQMSRDKLLPLRFATKPHKSPTSRAQSLGSRPQSPEPRLQNPNLKADFFLLCGPLENKHGWAFFR